MALSDLSPERFRALLFAHPSASPDGLGSLPYLIEPPSSPMSATSRYVRFRDLTLLPMMAERPDDPHLPKFLAAVEAVLAWREGVAPEERFWKADPE